MYLSTEWKIRLDSKIRSQNVYFHHSFWSEQTLAATKLFLSLTCINFVVAFSSRAVRVFQALSLRRVRPSYGTFSLMVFQGNCARGRTGHTGRKKAGRWNGQSALGPMCDAEKDWHERFFRASGAINGCQKSPLDKPEMTFSFFIFKLPVASF